VDRVTLFHRTRPELLPHVEVEGLRTRVDLSGRFGPVGAFDEAATGRFARGRRVSGWVSRAHADAQQAALGAGLVSYTVDPRKVVAQPASLREQDPVAAWAAARPLTAWLADAAGDVAALPDDLEVHQELPVRAKLVRILAPTFSADELGPYAPLVDVVADADRVAAKLLVHLGLIASDGDTATPAFRAACAFAWRDEADGPDLGRQVARVDAETVLEAVLVAHEPDAPEGTAALLAVVDELRSEAAAAGDDVTGLLLQRSEAALSRVLS
jgi:hypothetical protein